IHYFFFFQAEDGIRDFHVTGVQTCALPIWTPSRPSRPVIVPASPGCSAPSSDSRHGRGSLRPCAINLFCEGTNMSKKILVLPGEIGRASCRERGWILAVSGAIKSEDKCDDR